MRYVCSICGYVYDEAKQGKPFAALPETWTCPLCGAARSAFAPEAAAKSVAPAPTVAPPAPVHGDMQKLSPGALSILCSNLARGCEKQYKEEEAALFREIADWFAAAAPAAQSHSAASSASHFQCRTKPPPLPFLIMTRMERAKFHRRLQCMVSTLRRAFPARPGTLRPAGGRNRAAATVQRRKNVIE